MRAREPILAVDIVMLAPAWKETCPPVMRLVRKVARHAAKHVTRSAAVPHQRLTMAVALADDKEMARLNRRYRGKDGATNVLSFAAGISETGLPCGSPVALGDLVLSFETVCREACDQNKPLADHLSHLVVHGVLHLFGYDHESEADACRMESLERSILASLGVPDPYRDIMCSPEHEPNY